jgi:methyl-accepting chemotaxis protein
MPLFDNAFGLDQIKKELKERVDYLANIINTLTPEIRQLSDAIRENNRSQKELMILLKQQNMELENLIRALDKNKR